MHCLDRNEEGRKRREAWSLGSEPPLDWGTLHLGVVYTPERRRPTEVSRPGFLFALMQLEKSLKTGEI